MAIEKQALDRIAGWLAAGVPTVVVRVASARGSAPRDTDAAMAVTAQASAGTIGGGQLEWIAIARARDIAAGRQQAGSMAVPLGPEIGQCCGGRVELSFQPLDADLLAAMRRETAREEGRLPQVLVFGAGHTGRALATALAPLPVAARLIDSRPEILAAEDFPVMTVATPLPEEAVRAAPPRAAFVAMTHKHSLDFLIVAEALKRGDAAYVGMIGSATKRAVFMNWLDENGYGRELGRSLTCPIGGGTVRDKRPAVIAALTAAEIVAALHAVSNDPIT